MASILVGIDGTERGARALEWAAARAERTGAKLTLLAVANPAEAKKMKADPAALRAAVEEALSEAFDAVRKDHPQLTVESKLVEGKPVEALVDEAERHDLVVMGSHHGSTVGEAFGGAKGLRVSVSAKVPTVVVPCDWEAQNDREGIVVGLGSDNVSDDAVAFGVGESLDSLEPLTLVSAWCVPTWMARPAESLGPGLDQVAAERQAEVDEQVSRLKTINPKLQVVGKAIEGPSITRVLVDESANASLLVLGTHSRTALGRAMFGSTTHSLLLNLQVPTVVVPKA